MLAFDEAAASRFGLVGEALAARSESIIQMDTLIAAHALAESLTLVTKNSKHYARVPGLRTENWMVAE